MHTKHTKHLNVSQLKYAKKKTKQKKPLTDDPVEATFVGTFIPIVVTAIDAFSVVMATGFVVMLTDCVMSVLPTKVYCIDQFLTNYKSFFVVCKKWQYITYKIYRIFCKTFLQSPVTLDRYKGWLANEHNLQYPHMGENLCTFKLYCKQSRFLFL